MWAMGELGLLPEQVGSLESCGQKNDCSGVLGALCAAAGRTNWG